MSKYYYDNKKVSKKNFRNLTKKDFRNDIGSTRAVGGKLLRIGGSDLLLCKSSQRDENGNPIYVGTIMKRTGLTKRNVTSANHIVVKKL